MRWLSMRCMPDRFIASAAPIAALAVGQSRAQARPRSRAIRLIMDASEGARPSRAPAKRGSRAGERSVSPPGVRDGSVGVLQLQPDLVGVHAARLVGRVVGGVLDQADQALHPGN